jgi:hypothetical protein
MIVIGRQSLAEATRRPIQSGFYRADWMEAGADPILSPTVFMVEQPPLAELFPHFHIQNQFQLFVEGAGRIGRHKFDAVTVHYASAFTGYGPLTAGPTGLKYLTIRSVFEAGAIPLKDTQGRIPKGPKRAAASKPITVTTEEMLRELNVTVEKMMIGPASDGMMAIRTILPPGAVLPFVDGGAAQGRFVVVLAGDLIHEGLALTKWESLFATLDEPMRDLRAGTIGADIVSLFIPAKDPCYFGDHIPHFDRVVPNGPKN